MTQENKFVSIAGVAQRILDAYGRRETSDSSRVIYTVGDLNISGEAGLIEIIFRGTLVFRYAPAGGTDSPVFEEHGLWLKEFEQVSQALCASPSSGETT